ncbi:hypothetical protein [Brevibacterium oceani]|uniref:hypothetical protein n=1 Tax=Brevibacterium oceani TaxID=358099 RepID=UPI0015E71A74|nr:hypothetical protein [Brevibacterium oceani]
MTATRASNSKLAPGEDTINRAKPKKVGSTWTVKWSYLPDEPDARLKRFTNQGPTRGEALQRARDKLTKLNEARSASEWRLGDAITEYVEKVARPAVEKAKLSEVSRDRYKAVLRFLVGECSNEAHQHSKALDGSIRAAVRRRTLIECLEEIADEHGPGSAHHARIVLGHYVLDQLEIDELIETNPLKGRRVDLSGGKDRAPARGGVALSAEQWNAVLDYLLDLDPAEGVTNPKQGMYSLADKIAVRRNSIDLALMQAVTGLRVGEASSATWAMVGTDDDGMMVLSLSPEVTKTKRGRDVRIPDRAVSDRLLSRRGDAGVDWPIIGSPAKPEAIWNKRNRTMHTAKLYDELAEALDIPELRVERTHVWRATLNSLAAADGVPEAVRVAHLGHTAAVNRSSYTDLRDMTPLADSVRRLRAV